MSAISFTKSKRALSVAVVDVFFCERQYDSAMAVKQITNKGMKQFEIRVLQVCVFPHVKYFSVDFNFGITAVIIQFTYPTNVYGMLQQVAGVNFRQVTKKPIFATILTFLSATRRL